MIALDINEEYIKKFDQHLSSFNNNKTPETFTMLNNFIESLKDRQVKYIINDYTQELMNDLNKAVILNLDNLIQELNYHFGEFPDELTKNVLSDCLMFKTNHSPSVY